MDAMVALLFLGEPTTPEFLFAAILMAMGVWLHLTERHEHEHWHERLEHRHPHVHDEHHRHAHAPDDETPELHDHWHVHEPVAHQLLISAQFRPRVFIQL